ncbi:MAG: helix-turn-helix domain-containing protein [Bacteroidales bacterium]|nr:helix-turn-helix domain-containing protein [Bacteroidales bacterium]
MNYNYTEYQPDPLLSPYIENYWMSDGFGGKSDLYRILPDSYVNIIFMLDKTRGIFHTDIFGLITSYLEASSSQTLLMFGIRFKPAGITAFTRIPAYEFTDRSVDLALLDTLFDKSFYEPFPEKQSVKEIITHINNYLINCLPRLYSPEQQIIRAIDLIHLSKGQLSPAKVASEVCLSQRHFERKFKSAVGISPKTFAKILRFQHALQHLYDFPHRDLLSVAVECGYYDHTHLIKNFKTFSGSTPTALR